MSCFDDIGSCLFTLLCCPCAVARNKAMLDNRRCNILDCLFCFPCQEFFNRQQLRAKYGFEQEACGDCVSVFICTCCVVCQDYREQKRRETHISDAATLRKIMMH